MQTLALLIDSWRLLTSRKLFWLTLGLNLLVVLAYGSIGLTDTGVSLGYGLFHFEDERFRLGLPHAKTILWPFINVQIISFWLAWVATGLGLISTASIFPDFLADGAIDMVLAKPMSRWKAFAVKYLGSLLFVVMQVSVFCIGALIVARARLGEWEWTLLAAIPVVTVFFSYIYAISALVGIATRSSIAAILAAAVFWFSVFLVQAVEKGLLQGATHAETVATARAEKIAKREAELAGMSDRGLTSENSNDYERVRGRLENDKLEYEKENGRAATIGAWHHGFYIATMIVPKTSDTIGLIDRWFAKESGASTLAELLMTDVDRGPRPGPPVLRPDDDEGGDEEEEGLPSDLGRKSRERAFAAVADRPLVWVVGTSLAFELVVLLLAGAIFVRRDF
jgi:ABC-type transport system involved in multi-copper enzyme maturation permease subunit